MFKLIFITIFILALKTSSVESTVSNKKLFSENIINLKNNNPNAKLTTKKPAVQQPLNQQGQKSSSNIKGSPVLKEMIRFAPANNIVPLNNLKRIAIQTRISTPFPPVLLESNIGMSEYITGPPIRTLPPSFDVINPTINSRVHTQNQTMPTVLIATKIVLNSPHLIQRRQVLTNITESTIRTPSSFMSSKVGSSNNSSIALITFAPGTIISPATTIKTKISSFSMTPLLDMVRPTSSSIIDNGINQSTSSTLQSTNFTMSSIRRNLTQGSTTTNSFNSNTLSTATTLGISTNTVSNLSIQIPATAPVTQATTAVTATTARTTIARTTNSIQTSTMAFGTLGAAASTTVTSLSAVSTAPVIPTTTTIFAANARDSSGSQSVLSTSSLSSETNALPNQTFFMFSRL